MSMVKTGLIGCPVSHSLSPVIHGYWLSHYRIEGEYGLYDIVPPALEETLSIWKKNAPLRGVNVTVPHKQAVMPMMDQLDATAKTIGAVNTITVNADGTWHGANTDAYGFMAHLKAEIPDYLPLLKHAVVLGAGGAARAIVYALVTAGAERMTILNRSEEKAQELARYFGVESAAMERLPEILPQASLLVNTTSAGMKGNAPLVLPMALLPHDAAVYDIVYAPLVTPLLAEAHAHNLATIDGLGMLLYQAQKSFEKWHGILPEVTPELRTLVLEKIA